jgi:hypothetical protein
MVVDDHVDDMPNPNWQGWQIFFDDLSMHAKECW